MDDGAMDHVRDHERQAAASTTTTTTTTIMIPTWKLYENPFYIRPGNHDGRVVDARNINMDGNERSGVCSLGKFVKDLMEPELEELRSRLEEMRSRVENERKARKKAERTSERLSRELVEEKGAREALERMCERLAKEVRDEREAVDLLRGEIEEERRMMRVAEVLREERVQMKLAEARAALEDRIEKLEGTVNVKRKEEEAVKDGDLEKCTGEKERAARGDLSENTGNGQGKGTARRASPEAENPHITRGIKGFVEFPRVLRGVGSRSGNGRTSWGPAKVDYHRAQIRILLKQAGSPVKSD